MLPRTSLHQPAAALLLGFVVAATAGLAQSPEGGPWSFRTSALITGSSQSSTPDGYRALSAVGLGVGLRREFTRILTGELDLAFASREMVLQDAGREVSLGSLETVPINLLLQLRPSVSKVLHPYLGVGLNVTPVWEKTGALDSYDVPATLGVALQLGADYDLSSSMLLNLDFSWNTAEPDFELDGVRATTVTINPFTASAGLGFRF